MTRARKITLWALLIVILLPVVLIVGLIAAVRLADRTNGTIVTSGITRRYLLYVPTSYNASKPVPLVVTLHPAAGWPALVQSMSGWDQLAEEHGFLVVYPAGTSFPQIWSTHRPDADTRFISDLLDKLQHSYNIDPARIYVNGMSQGGGMAFLLSCKLPGRFAAVGEVAAAQEHPFSTCADTTPVPMIAFHGTADRYAPYRGGISPVEPPHQPPFPAIPDFVADWAHRNQCGADSVEAPVAASVRLRRYTHCAQNADVFFYIISGGGHTWPGGQDWQERLLASPTHEISATRLMWDFYVQHPREMK